MNWQYDIESAIDQHGTDAWSTTISDAWSIGANPNGGYAMASSMRAMARLVQAADSARDSEPKLDPVSVTTHFLRPSSGGEPGTITAELVRPGKRSSSAMASLIQNGTERLRVMAAFGDLGNESGTAEADGGWAVAPELSIDPVEVPDPEDCRDRRLLEQGVDLPILSRLDVRIDPELAEPGVGGRAEVAGWIRFRDGRPVDSAGLVLFADAFPPSLYSLLGRVGWVPTLELTVHVRRRPAPGWVRARFRTSDLTNGMLVEDGELWDSSGALVARSRQLALLLPPGT